MKIFRQMINDSAFFWLLLFPLLVVALVDVSMYAYGSLQGSIYMMNLAGHVGNIGTVSVMMVALGYILVIEFRKLRGRQSSTSQNN